MSRSIRCSGPLAAVLLLVLGVPVGGQIVSFPVQTGSTTIPTVQVRAPFGGGNRGPTVSFPVQTGSTTIPTVQLRLPIGGQTSPSLGTFGNATLAGGGRVNPYALSTLAGLNATGGSGFGSQYNPYSPYYSLDLGPTGGALYGYGYALQGMASLTTANAGYWKGIQTAALQREGVRQESLNTERRRIELEQWYDSVRPTAVSMRTRELSTDLDTARKMATETDILSGQALNTLLASIKKADKRSGSPPVALEEDVVRRLNVTAGTSGNVGLLKDGGKLNWPEEFQGEQFDEPRKRLTRNIALAVQTLKDGEAVRPDLLRDIRADAKTIAVALDDMANDLAPPDYIEGRRFLRQLDNAITALADPKVVNYFNNTWQARGKNVAELVAHMTRNGLLFAPGTPGDEAAYRAAYLGLRAYEAGLQPGQRSIETGR